MMKKRIATLAITFIMLITVFAQPTALADEKDSKYYNEAVTLKTLSLFIGTGAGFDLDSQCNRLHALVIFIRLIGEEQLALQTSAEHPFVDVPTWADKYVSYAYAKGYTKGSGNDESGKPIFDVGNVTANQFCTFILRALDYKDNIDFVWNKAADKAVELNILTAAEYAEMKDTLFLRGSAVRIAYLSLYANSKGTDKALLVRLLENNVFDKETVYSTQDSDLIAVLGEDVLPVVEGETANNVEELNALLDRIKYNIQPYAQINLKGNLAISDIRNYYNANEDSIHGFSVKTYGDECEIEFEYSDSHALIQADKSSYAKANLSKELLLASEQVDAILASIITEDITSDYDKEKVIHDYLVKTYTYDTSLFEGDMPEISYSILGLLNNGKGVCQAYAELFGYMLYKVGIESHFIIGTANGGSHIWNIVKLEGEYYQVDVTFDDPIPDMGGVSYSYFNITDEQMALDHQWEREQYTIKCSATDLNYYRAEGKYFESREKILPYLQNAVNNKITVVELMCSFEIGENENYTDIIYNELKKTGYRNVCYIYGSDNILTFELTY